MPHRFAIALLGAEPIGAFTVTKSGLGRNGREQDRHVVNLPQDFSANNIALRRVVDDLIERHRRLWIGKGKILAQNRADLFEVALHSGTEQVGDHRSEEKPPDLKRAIEAGKLERFDDHALRLKKPSGTLD